MFNKIISLPSNPCTSTGVDSLLLLARVVYGEVQRGETEWYADQLKEAHKEYCMLLQQYLEMELTLKISDEPMRRLCQVLTNFGFETIDSCDGHGKRLPSIFFKCSDQSLLRELAHILSRGSRIKHFPWVAEIWSSDPYFNPHQSLNFLLRPSSADGPLHPDADYNILLQDLDLIGLSILNHFNSFSE